MKQIPLSQGKFALVDDKDYDFLMQWKWYFNRDGYAVRKQAKKETINKRKNLFMHRVILKTPDGKFTDHINRNRIDNRKNNLRIVTISQNAMNQNRKIKNKSSQFKGVFWCKMRKKFVASLRLEGRNIFLLASHSEIDAAIAYNTGAKKFFGEFARLNVISS